MNHIIIDQGIFVCWTGDHQQTADVYYDKLFLFNSQPEEIVNTLLQEAFLES